MKARIASPNNPFGISHNVLGLMLVLAFELEVASYMTLNDVGRNAMVVPDELVGQSGTGKVGLRLGKNRLFWPSVHGDGQRAARERDLDRARVSKVDPLVDADIFRQDFWRHRHRGFLSVRSSPDPVLLSAVQTFIADGFQYFRVRSQARADWEGPGFVVSPGIIERHCYFQVAEVGASEALRHTQRFCVRIALDEPCPVVEPVGLHDQRVSFPAAY